MQIGRLLTTLLTAAVALAPVALADEPATTTQPADHPADKWRYNLFNPVPRDELRDMDTDRPNATNTPHTIDAGHVQLEAGLVDYLYDRIRDYPIDERTDAWAFGQLNFRLGVLNDLEVNAAFNSYQTSLTHEYRAGKRTTSHGFGDTVVGGKLNLWGNEAVEAPWASALAVQPQFKIPTARGVSGDRFEWTVVFPFLVDLPHAWHLSLQPGYAELRNSSNTGYVSSLLAAASIDRVVWHSIDVYVEYSAVATRERHTKASQTLDVGATYPLTKNVVLDTGVNIGLNKASNTLEWLAGVSVRF